MQRKFSEGVQLLRRYFLKNANGAFIVIYKIHKDKI